MKVQTTPFVQQKTIENCVTVTLLNSGIVELQWDNSLIEISAQQLINVKHIIGELGEGKKMPVLVSVFDFMAISNEAKDYSATEDSQEYTLANAVIIDNMAKKMVFNFFMKFNRPKTPTKSFTTREQAIDWLLAVKSAGSKQFL